MNLGLTLWKLLYILGVDILRLDQFYNYIYFQIVLSLFLVVIILLLRNYKVCLTLSLSNLWHLHIKGDKIKSGVLRGVTRVSTCALKLLKPENYKYVSHPAVKDHFICFIIINKSCISWCCTICYIEQNVD